MTADPHLDTAAYALHAIPADEAVGVENHLESCESCSAELIGFLETASLLGSAVAERPPARLREAILARVAVTAQLPPITASGSSRWVLPEAAASGTAAGERGTGDFASDDRGTADRAIDDPGTTGSLTAGTEQTESRRSGRGTHRADVTHLQWYRRPGALIAAAVAAVVLGAGAFITINRIAQNDEVAQTPEQCVAQAADQRQITPAQGGGTVRYAPSCGVAVLDVTGLPALPSNRTYQLWALAGATPRSLGTLPDASAGKQQLFAAQTQSGENAVAITAEPAGGSPAPTLPILWQAALTS